MITVYTIEPQVSSNSALDRRSIHFVRLPAASVASEPYHPRSFAASCRCRDPPCFGVRLSAEKTMKTNSCRYAIFAALAVWFTFCLANSRCWADDAHVLLFESGKEGYPRYRIPTLVVARSGALVAVCEGRVDGGGLTGNVDLVSKRSFNNGKNWSARTLVAEAADDTLGNASALVDRETGVIWIAGTISPGKQLESAITRGETETSTRVFVMNSRDDGKTWSTPRDITSVVKRPGWTWYGCGPGVGIQLKNGRLFFPCYHAEGEQGRTKRTHAIFSDDHGKTWQLSANAGTGNGEPQALQREDGSIYVSARTASGGPHVRSIIESQDNGATWSEKRFDESIYDCYCQASLLNLPSADAKPRWLYCHPAGPSRRDLTIRLSRDEGRTWDAGSLLLREGNGQYSSMALLPNGCVGVLYDLWENNNYQLYFTAFSLDDVAADSVK